MNHVREFLPHTHMAGQLLYVCSHVPGCQVQASWGPVWTLLFSGSVHLFHSFGAVIGCHFTVADECKKRENVIIFSVISVVKTSVVIVAFNINLN